MATYPAFEWVRDQSRTDVDDGIQPMRASNGALKVRRLFPADKRAFVILHWLSDSERATLVSFYATNKALNVDLVPPDTGAAAVVRFGRAPVYELQGGYWTARVLLLEV